MSTYTITACIFQANDTRGCFRIVEKAVWSNANGGTWDEVNGTHVLTMGGSGTCGIMRFKNADTGEDVAIALGVHNYKRWCDAVTGLSGQTAASIISQYYTGPDSQGRQKVRESQLQDYSIKSAVGRQYRLHYTVADGNNLKVNIMFS